MKGSINSPLIGNEATLYPRSIEEAGGCLRCLLSSVPHSSVAVEQTPTRNPLGNAEIDSKERTEEEGYDGEEMAFFRRTLNPRQNVKAEEKEEVRTKNPHS